MRLAAILMVCASLGAPAGAQAPDVNKVLADIRATDKGQLAISEEDGRFLRLMIASGQRKRVLEIGGASGYSAIWMAQGLRVTGGKMVRVARARAMNGVTTAETIGDA
jgi:predicted O-methyltransferase YrrM